MGLQDVKKADPEELRKFMKLLLRDARALEQMLEDGMIESSMRRIGAEQELFLVDKAFQPATRSPEILEKLDDRYFTTELGLFNIEYNLDPVVFGKDCLSVLEKQLEDLLADARQAAGELGMQILLTGILPTMQLSDLSLDNMTPKPRYFALNDALNKMRNGSYNFNIKGADEFIVQHDNVMLESCNTSFQVHFQVGAEEFPKLYNVAQVAAAPIMAVATNSPMLFGKRLWRETRIALFQQSIDTRASGHHIRERMPRVSFGSRWVEESALEIYQEDISRFRVLINTDVDEDPFEVLENGGVPTLKALRLHSGTVYRWNRVCYGISEGEPHLRIENRVLPSGPTTRDEMANATFWFGLLNALAEEYEDVSDHMEFDDAKSNFIAAARQGLGAPLQWLDGKMVPARELVLDRLLPVARESLKDRGLDPDDVDRHLDVIKGRVESEHTGSAWILNSFAQLKGRRTMAERMSAITAAMLENQKEGAPVHEWPLADPSQGAEWEENFSDVSQFMTTDLFTVNEDELIDLVASVMDWQHLRHVPVENDAEDFVGMVTYRSLLRHLSHDPGQSVPVSSIMETDVPTATTKTSTIEAIRIMREGDVSCLPVLQDGKLVGVVSERDFIEIAEELLEEKFPE